MKKGWGKREGLGGFRRRLPACSKKGRCGQSIGHKDPCHPQPHNYLALKMLCSQLYILKTCTKSYPHGTPVTHILSLNIGDLTPPIIHPFPKLNYTEDQTKPTRPRSQGLRLPYVTMSAGVKGDSRTRSMWEGEESSTQQRKLHFIKLADKNIILGWTDKKKKKKKGMPGKEEVPVVTRQGRGGWSAASLRVPGNAYPPALRPPRTLRHRANPITSSGTQPGAAFCTLQLVSPSTPDSRVGSLLEKT